MKTNKKWMIATAFASIFGLAISTGIRGILVPNFIDSFGVTDGQIGMLFTATTFFSVFAIYYGSQWGERVGLKKVILSAQVVSGLLFLAVSQVSGYTLFVIGYSMIQFCISLLIISLNTMATVIQVRYPAILVNLVHFFFGLGLTFSQRAGGELVARGFDWVDLFRMVGILYFLTAAMTFFMKEPNTILRAERVKLRTLPNKGYLALLAMGVGFYVASELQTANWIVYYLKTMYDFAEDRAGGVSAIFFGLFTIGRLLGGVIAEKLGYVRSVVVFTVSASVLYVSGMLLGELGLYLIAGAGFFYSLVFPMVTIILARDFGQFRATAIALVSTAGNLMTLITSLLIGGMTDWIGIGTGYWVIPVSIVLSAASFMVAFGRQRTMGVRPAEKF
ncbi:MFS transporter [Acidaminobacter hydrogenoformans]|uniref:Fucose permease n=1 Tax=Acidaminobacter hydrogenoformans DSM 2784 TaxID=1120920 RepID=A0A1G5RYB9_9FIRM|nr:MFS transporter [Acidaminobacter hydrogenoformans]SCZ78451.1 Fucose permease [Acidaminobacter hydrogenoformans DSM 2784]